jgi:hypothetical protein
MKGSLHSRRWRTAIGLIAAYAIALQAVFTTLAPMPADAAGSADLFAAHCFGNGNAALPESEPGAPAPASGKMHCVFCGACAGGFVVIPTVVIETQSQTVATIAFILPSSAALPVANNARDGPARAPPHAV